MVLLLFGGDSFIRGLGACATAEIEGLKGIDWQSIQTPSPDELIETPFPESDLTLVGRAKSSSPLNSAVNPFCEAEAGAAPGLEGFSAAEGVGTVYVRCSIPGLSIHEIA